MEKHPMTAEGGDQRDQRDQRDQLDQGVLLRSEFARVIVRVDRGANGPRLHVRAVGSDAEIFLDPFELASLAAARHEALADLVMPERLRTESDEWALHPH
jgi:hypothetical protein